MEIITRRTAKGRGLARYYTGKPCKHGHVVERAIDGHCIECQRNAHPEKDRRYRANHPERVKECNRERRTARLKQFPEYTMWVGMKQRCTNPNHRYFYLYGGQGIRVCDRWRNSFEAFLADMGRRPTPQHSIDRYPDRDGNYYKENCRWATKQEQRLNQQSPRKRTAVA